MAAISFISSKRPKAAFSETVSKTVLLVGMWSLDIYCETQSPHRHGKWLVRDGIKKIVQLGPNLS